MFAPFLQPAMSELPQAILLGTPHSGKTSLFNCLTGTNRPVGMTVEEVHEVLHTEQGDVDLIDLPGVYRLGENSPEEALTMHCLTRHRPKLVISVVDSTNLDVQLYLTLQLWHFGWQVLLVLNMADVAMHAGLSFNTRRLEELIGVMVVRTDAFHGQGIRKLRSIIGATCYDKMQTGTIRRPEYGEAVDRIFHLLTHAYESEGFPPHDEPTSYIASRLLEGNSKMIAHFTHHGEKGQRFLQIVNDCRDTLEREFGTTPAELLTDKRYGVIHGLVGEVLSGRASVQDARMMTLALDRLLTHRYFGMLFFVGIMFLIFYISFTLGNPMVEAVQAGFDWLSAQVGPLLSGHPLLQSLVTRGIIGGAGGVVSFVPTIVILFACLSLLESTGYMARAAFLMDRFMHKMGLHGKSFIPMLLGFSCNVPAVLSTRSIESRTDRLATIFVLPLMNCSARLVVFTLIIQALVPPAWRTLTLWGLYILGVAMAVLIARLLKSTIFCGEDELFIMELPSYRLPRWRSYLLSVWEKASGYLKKAATFILFGSILLWVFNTFPLQYNEQGETEVAHPSCYSARVGRIFEPISRYAGMDWQANSAMIGAFSAKELLVTQLCILFKAEPSPAAEQGMTPEQKQTYEETLKKQAIRSHYNIPQALGIMTFALLALPCLGTVAVVLKETGSRLFTILQFLSLNLIGFLAAVLVYQLASLFS